MFEEDTGLYNVRHSTWADFDPATRCRASLSMWKYISGDLPRLPDSAVEIYSNMVNQAVIRFDSIRIE